MSTSFWCEIVGDQDFRRPSPSEEHHADACCAYHGCIFGEPEDCPVVTLQIRQNGDCEDCAIDNPIKRNSLEQPSA